MRRTRRSEEAGATFDVQSAADDTGLPMLVVRAPFNMVWQKLPAGAEKLGEGTGQHSLRAAWLKGARKRGISLR